MVSIRYCNNLFKVAILFFIIVLEGVKTMKSYIAIGICLMMILASAVVVTADPEPFAGPNYWGFSTPTSVHKTLSVGSTFTTAIWVNILQLTDTVSVENMTFTPGIMDYASTAQGALFTSYTVYMEPETNGAINNVIGYANPCTGASQYERNNTNGTLATITWTMKTCGKVDFSITDGGTAYAGDDISVTFIPFSIWIHPASITGFSATKVNSTKINLAWTKQAGDDKTLIRYKSGSAPTSVTDGTFLYNGTGTSTSHTGLSSGQTWYYSAWGWNDTSDLYTLLYSTASAATNSAPYFGTPSPQNDSINRPISFTWSIPITDPDNDAIDWTIECNNTQSNSGSGAGGTKSLYLTGLKYNTTYTIWVNATDGEFTIRAWYRFTTKTKEGGGGGGGGAAPQEINTIRVSVSHNGIPVNATIRINEGTTPQSIGVLVAAITTGIDGNYSFGLDTGTYILTVTAPGYQPYQKMLVVTGDATELVILQSTGQPFCWWCLLIIILIICLVYYLYSHRNKKWYDKL